MADPTAEELEVLKEFRVKVRDLGLENSSDLNLLQCIRVRDLKIPSAEELLRKHLKWREEEDLDNILEWKAPENFETDLNYKITGHDNEGHPILIQPFGVWEVRKIITSGKKGIREAYLRYIDQMFARVYPKMKELSVQFGREVTQCVMIVDFANFSMRQFTSVATLSAFLEAARRVDSNYPELFFRVYFINAFRAFQIFFPLLKPVMGARTLEILEIYTTPDKWRPIFMSRLPKDQLPIQYGGTQADSNIAI